MKKIYFMFISVIICAFLFAACGKTDILEWDTEKSDSVHTTDVDFSDNQGQPVPFQVGAIVNTRGSSKETHNLFAIVRSKEELDRAASERYYQYWTDMGGPYNVYYLMENTEKYDEDFFAENALVLYLFESSYSGGRIDITQLQRQDDGLTIITDFHGGSLPAVSYWTVVIEAAQTDVYGITSLKTKNECDCPYFSFDLILVSLTPEATVAAYNAGKAYTPADFPEFNFSRVDNLFTMEPTGPFFKRILFLYLAEPGKENVLTAVELIGRRPDVSFAGPDYYF
ncbi:MAG: hypothetical protein LBH20_00630 [Treponema sp.]|nr:hypothetical protein [Treponema sp.]